MQKKFFFKILLSCYFAGVAKIFSGGGGGGAKAQISHISKSVALRIKVFSSIDSATLVSYLSAIHYAALTPLFFELFSKTILHVLHAGVSWSNPVRYPLHVRAPRAERGPGNSSNMDWHPQIGWASTRTQV